MSGVFDRTGRSSRGNNGTVEASVGDDINLDRGVSTRVVDGASVDLSNSHCGGSLRSDTLR